MTSMTRREPSPSACHSATHFALPTVHNANNYLKNSLTSSNLTSPSRKSSKTNKSIMSNA